MKAVTKETWKTPPTGGQGHFILQGLWRRGLKFALPAALGYFLFDALTQHLLNPVSETISLVLIFALIMLVAGWAGGAYLWVQKMQSPQNLQKNSSAPRPLIPEATMTTTIKTNPDLGTPAIEVQSSDSPFIFEFFQVEGRSFRGMAYRDREGKWRGAFNNLELPGTVEILA